MATLRKKKKTARIRICGRKHNEDKLKKKKAPVHTLTELKQRENVNVIVNKKQTQSIV